MRDIKGVIKLKNHLNNLSFLIYHFSFQKGFTLIELIVVFSTIAFLSIVGLASYFSYSQGQTLNAVVNELVTTIQLARSRAISQVKPPSRFCEGQLDGYRIEISFDRMEYKLGVACGGNDPYPMQIKTLPRDITFDENDENSTTTTNIFFPIISGGVQGYGDIVICGYGQGKKITVTSTGVVRVQTFASCP